VQKVFAPHGSKLGAGVFGSCRAVREELSGEVMCAKVALVSSVGEVARTNLRVEFAALSTMNHPNVMRAFSLTFDPAGKLHAMLMPLMTSDLAAWLRDRLPTSSPAAAEEPLAAAEKSCLLQVAAGLGHCHGRGIMHLDIKPENVLVDGGAQPPRFAISDFGNCESVEDLDGLRCTGRVAASRVNSPPYRPFELFRCYDSLVGVRPRFDIWAFGCLMYEVGNVQPQQRRHRVPWMMEGVRLDGVDARTLELARNARVTQYARACLRPIILAVQPRSTAAGAQVKAAALHGLLRHLPVV